jgi:uncharacterized OsmC-like protein
MSAIAREITSFQDKSMNADALRAAQAPFKEKYRTDPAGALITLQAQGTLDSNDIVCRVQTPRGEKPAGLHPGAGGDASKVLCAGDMLLEALVGCTGVTLKAVATALGIAIRRGSIRVEGDMDFRGTLGVNKETPVGFQKIRLAIELDSDASQEQVDKLLQLTKRYCVVYQTLSNPPQMTAEVRKG